MVGKKQTTHKCLFLGVRDTGKITVASFFTKYLNYEQPTEDGLCLECESCKEALSDTNNDIHEMGATSHNGVAPIS